MDFPQTTDRPERPETLSQTIRGCRICREAPFGAPLPIEPNPVLVLSSTARIVIASQAPGNLADRSGTPFNDPSGVRLRDWMGIGREIFYDVSRVAIVPMGFCFPGYDGKGGDLPPRRECRATWHERVMAAMPQIELILAIGLYAQRFHIEGNGTRSLTETVADWRNVLATGGRFAPVLPMPHPSWRNNAWLKRHPWFAAELLPELKSRVAALV
ncbi:uracil-DNA glycosylase family protein [Jiella endophytica]|uniref:Uracil-DNA glycosylase family protein n=1 Tax=Jiella endophytica TaxID=2558362 RepID=A0A4Y8RP01_9HYPH|nr:uracil-DNA glycosylase family protein [Jiella endophytica]TFF25309.1 uracil-DNA glycosylase family protein [Jiella endophytica]